MPSVLPTRPTRPLPSVTPSERQRLNQEVRMQVDTPEWRGTLEQALKNSKTRIVAETFNRETFWELKPGGSALTPEEVKYPVNTRSKGGYHLFAATQRTADFFESIGVLKDVLQKDPKLSKTSAAVFLHLLVEMGIEMMEYVPGPHFTFIDPRFALLKNGTPPSPDAGERPAGPSDNIDFSRSVNKAVQKIIKNARLLHVMFEEAGADPNLVIIGIPATRPGVLAAAELEQKYDIRTNLSFVSGLVHAAACAEVRPAYITLDVASILEWYERSAEHDNFKNWEGLTAEALITHPGIVAIQSILRYYKFHSIKTQIVGRNFRTPHEVSLLGNEFDVLSLSPSTIYALHRARLPLCVPQISMDSTASHAARTGPPFPTTMVSTRRLNSDEKMENELNFDWVHSEMFLNPGISPLPSVLLASITIHSLSQWKIQMEQLFGPIKKSALQKVELRVLPLPVLYARRRARGVWDDAAERYGYKPTSPVPGEVSNDPHSGSLKRQETLLDLNGGSRSSSSATIRSPSPSGSLKRQETLLNLKVGFRPSSSATIHSPSPSRPFKRHNASAHIDLGSDPSTIVRSPSPRRPSPRRSFSHTSESSTRSAIPAPKTTPMLAFGSETARGKYASTEEVTKILANILESTRTKPKSETDRANTIMKPPSGPSGADKTEDSVFGSYSAQSPVSGSSGAQMAAKAKIEGQDQLLSFDDLLKRREGPKKQEVEESMVEGIDFF